MLKSLDRTSMKKKKHTSVDHGLVFVIFFHNEKVKGIKTGAQSHCAIKGTPFVPRLGYISFESLIAAVQ